MPTLFIRDLEPSLLARLEKRANEHERSLEEELRAILTAAGAPEQRTLDKAAFTETVRVAGAMRGKTAGKITGDSADLIREDRDR